MNLRKTIADLIYEADWEISQKPTHGVRERHMNNEEEVVDTIIQTVYHSLKQTTRNEQ